MLPWRKNKSLIVKKAGRPKALLADCTWLVDLWSVLIRCFMEQIILRSCLLPWHCISQLVTQAIQFRHLPMNANLELGSEILKCIIPSFVCKTVCPRFSCQNVLEACYSHAAEQQWRARTQRTVPTVALMLCATFKVISCSSSSLAHTEQDTEGSKDFNDRMRDWQLVLAVIGLLERWCKDFEVFRV